MKLTNGKNLLIGSSGFLGKVLRDELQAEKADITLLNRQLQRNWQGAQYDLADLENMPTDFEKVFLLAARVPYGQMERFDADLIRANVLLVARVAEKFSASRLVFASSVSVYGQPLKLPISETHPFNATSAYGLSKLAAEIILQGHPNSVALRFSSLYGPGMASETFLPRILLQARSKGEVTLWGDGSRSQDYLCVKDAAHMLREAGRGQATGLFNAVNGTSLTNVDVAQTVAELVGGVKISFVGRDESPSFRYSTEKWKENFAYSPETNFKIGLKELLDYEN